MGRGLLLGAGPGTGRSSPEAGIRNEWVGWKDGAGPAPGGGARGRGRGRAREEESRGENSE